MELTKNNIFDVGKHACVPTDEIREELYNGSGVVIIRRAYRDMHLLDRVSTMFRKRIEAEENIGISTNNVKITKSNKRLVNVLNKFGEDEPLDFIEYYSNKYLHDVCRVCLGPIYQIISEVNVVVPGECSQMGHRDYPLGFYSLELMKDVPFQLAAAAPYLTLQAGVVHHDIPIEMGPTRFFLGSQNNPNGFSTWRDPEEQNRFKSNAVQFEFLKGDLVFFNPAIFHGAGGNYTAFPRMINLLQISCGMVKPLAHVDFVDLVSNIYPFLLQVSEVEKAERVCRVITDCWPFPTNFHTDPPKPDLNAGLTDKDWLLNLWRNNTDSSLVVIKYAEKLLSRIYSNKKTNPVQIGKREKLLQLVKSQSRVAVYPAGGMASDFTKNEFFKYLNVVAFFDKNRDKVGDYIAGIEILDINKIAEISPSIIIIAVSGHLLTDVVSDLDNLGLFNTEKMIL